MWTMIVPCAQPGSPSTHRSSMVSRFEDGFVHPESLIDVIVRSASALQAGQYSTLTFQERCPCVKALQLSPQRACDRGWLDRGGFEPPVVATETVQGPILVLPNDEPPWLAMGLAASASRLQDFGSTLSRAGAARHTRPLIEIMISKDDRRDSLL